MTIIIILSLVCAVATLFSVIAIIFALKAIIEVKAMQKSTHSVTWMPMEGKEWANSEKEINDINKQLKEELLQEYE